LSALSENSDNQLELRDILLIMFSLILFLFYDD
jgi:hypothetical protein